ncbi:hypothetical protein BHE74_00000625 [Ensete ventricosum]|nr:hypothetical protein BHE74_00000625 [Ensete ventricosum]
MTIGNFSPVGNNGQRRGKRILEEEAPLLPSKQEETGEFDEFNGASFAGPVFNLSTTPGSYSLRFTSALSVALAIVFVVITAGIAIVKLLAGSIAMPKLFPDIPDLTSVWNFFTVVPVIVTAYICHYNGMDTEISSKTVQESFFGFLLFGEATLDGVLANFDSNLGIPYSSVLDDVVRVSYAAHLMLVFIIFASPISTKWDKIVAVFMIGLAVLSNVIAIYSDAYALFNESRASPES